MSKGCRAFSDPEIQGMQKELGRKSLGLRNRAFFTLGWQTGFRISELLAIRLQDVIENGEITKDIRLRKSLRKGGKKNKAQKNGTKKQSRIESITMYVPQASRKALEAWTTTLWRIGFRCKKDLLFQTRDKTNKAISRKYAWKIIRDAADKIGYTGPIGTHSLRKTFAQKFYNDCLRRQGKGEVLDALVETQEALGHRDVASTIAYLGLNKKNTRRLCREIFDNEEDC